MFSFNVNILFWSFFLPGNPHNFWAWILIDKLSNVFYSVAQSYICQLSGGCSLHNWLHNNLEPPFYLFWYDLITFLSDHFSLNLMLSDMIIFLSDYLSYPILSHLIWSSFCLITFHLILSYLITSHLILSNLIQSDIIHMPPKQTKTTQLRRWWSLGSTV